MEEDGPEVLETGGALNVRYRGRLLYPERGPLSLAARTAAAAELGPDRLYLLPSPLLWYGIPELLARIEEGSALLCLEEDPGLAALAQRHLPPGLAGEARLGFLASCDPERALEACRALGRFRRVVLLRMSGGEALHREAYAQVAARLQAEFAAHWRSQASLMSMGRLWTRNIFRNLAALPGLALAPAPSFPGALAVCGAGPSLEKGLPFLARESASGRLAVLAVDTALGSLLQAGVRPDLVVCLEGQAHNLADFVPGAGSGIPLLSDLSSHPASTGILGGPVCLSSVAITPSPFLERLWASLRHSRLPFLECPPLGSVGVHSLHLARRLAGGPVLALGLDFAFEVGKTHAKASPSLLDEERRLDRLHPWPRQAAAAWREGVRATDEGLRTDPVLASYGALLADEASKPGPPVYDLRGRGLDLGLPKLGLEGASRLLDGLAAPPPKDPPQALPSPAARKGLAQGILKGELARLDRIEAAMKGRLSLPGTALAALVQESDYLLWPLPDGHRLESLAQDLLNRLLVEVQYWRWKLGDVDAFLDEAEDA